MYFGNLRQRAANVLLFATLGSFVCISGCDKPAPVVKQHPLAINAIKVTPSNELMWIETLGETEGVAQVEVRPQVSGILKAIRYQEGSHVKAGQTLFVIDQAPFQASLDAAKASVQQMKATYEQAKRDADRYAKLIKTKAISQKTYDDSQSAMRVARANLLSAKAKQAQAEIDMEHTLVKATSDGITNRAEVNVGTLVSASSTRLTTLTQPKNLRIKFQLSERDLNGHDVNEHNLIRLYDDLGHTIPAKIDFVSQQIDVTTATRSVRATILDPTHVYAGQLLRVQIATHRLENVFRIPQRCVQQKPDGSYEVFTVIGEKIQPVQVIVGNWKDTDWVILKGLKGGELIAVNQLQRLREGTSVKTTVVDRKTLP